MDRLGIQSLELRVELLVLAALRLQVALTPHTDLIARLPPRVVQVRYMVSVIQYGGRITDDFDQLLMDTYAEKYFNPPQLLVRA